MSVRMQAGVAGAFATMTDPGPAIAPTALQTGGGPAQPALRSAALLLMMLLSAGCAGTAVTPLPAPETGASASRSVPVDVGQARAAYDRRQFETARRLFAEAAVREPNNFEAALGLGEALLALGNEDAAEPQFVRAAEGSRVGAQIARAQLGLGLVHLRRGDYARAQDLLERSSRTDATAWRAWVALGQVHDRRREFSSARAAYRQAERAGPGEATVLNDVGMSLLSEDRLPEAVDYFQRALAADPSMPEARQNIRLAHARARRYEEAVAGAEEGEQPSVLNNVGYVAILNGDYDTARSLLDEAVRVSPQYNATAAANLKLLQSLSAGEG